MNVRYARMQWHRLSVGEWGIILAIVLPYLMRGKQNTALCQKKETVPERTQILVLCMCDFDPHSLPSSSLGLTNTTAPMYYVI
jgi:hypothetical protein